MGGGGGKGAGSDGGGCDVLGMAGKVGATAEVLGIVAHQNMIVGCLNESYKTVRSHTLIFLYLSFSPSGTWMFTPTRTHPDQKFLQRLFNTITQTHPPPL